MSAYVVDKAHIDAMIAAGLAFRRYNIDLSWYHAGERHYLRHDNASEVGAMLWAENVASVEHRYSPPGREATYGEAFGEAGDIDLPGSYQLETLAPGIAPVEVPQWLSDYRFPPRTRVRKPVEILKAISCYGYQSCEHENWPESEAFAFCAALQSIAIGQLPGYDDADWSIS